MRVVWGALRTDMPKSLMLRMASFEAAEPMDVCPFARSKIRLWSGPRGFRKTKKWLSWSNIDNKMKQIRPQDYFAPTIGEFELLILLALNHAWADRHRTAPVSATRFAEHHGPQHRYRHGVMALGRLEKKRMVASCMGLPVAQRSGGPAEATPHGSRGTEGGLGRAYRAFAAMANGIEGDLDLL